IATARIGRGLHFPVHRPPIRKYRPLLRPGPSRPKEKSESDGALLINNAISRHRHRRFLCLFSRRSDGIEPSSSEETVQRQQATEAASIPEQPSSSEETVQRQPEQAHALDPAEPSSSEETVQRQPAAN